MSDNIDEAVFGLQLMLDKAAAEGRTTATFTAPINTMHVMLTCVRNYFRSDVPPCFLCGMMRDLSNASDAMKNIGLGHNPNWRRDARRWK